MDNSIKSRTEEFCQKLCEALADQSNEWRFDHHQAELPLPNYARPITVSIGRGLLFVDTYPATGRFSLWQKVRLWHAVKIARANAGLRELNSLLRFQDDLLQRPFPPITPPI